MVNELAARCQAFYRKIYGYLQCTCTFLLFLFYSNENTMVCDTITSDNVTITTRTENMTGACCKDRNGDPLVDEYVVLGIGSFFIFFLPGNS